MNNSFIWDKEELFKYGRECEKHAICAKCPSKTECQNRYGTASPLRIIENHNLYIEYDNWIKKKTEISCTQTVVIVGNRNDLNPKIADLNKKGWLVTSLTGPNSAGEYLLLVNKERI